MSVASTDPPDDLPPRLVLYDGVCGVCDRYVQWLLSWEEPGTFHFAALQGETTAGLRERYPEIPDDLDSIVFIEDGRLYLRSTAVLRASRHLRFPMRLLYGFLVVPAFVRDLVYNRIAAVRYRIWGTIDSCRIPGPGELERFLA